MKVTLKQLEDKISLKLEALTSIERPVRALLAGPVFQAYRQAMDARFASQNQTEGSQWAALNKKYKEWKEKHYANGPGGGKKMLLRTGALYQSLVNPNGSNGGLKIVGKSSLKIVTKIVYAPYVNAARDFSRWGDPTMKKIQGIITGYLRREI